MKRISRRNFLKAAGVGAAALSWLPVVVLPAPLPPAPHLPLLLLQLRM